MIVVFADCGCAPRASFSTAEPAWLEPGKTVKCQFAAGQAHQDRFTSLEGQYARPLLFQHFINVAVECFGPDGKLRFQAYSQRIDDAEIAELIADGSGTYRFRVTAPDQGVPPGLYDITVREIFTVREIEAATERHKSRISADRRYAQAWKSAKEPSRENLLKALANFETAAGYWRADRFYEGMLARGERPAAALRAAQVATWKTKGWDAPYNWAAFTLQREWR